MRLSSFAAARAGTRSIRRAALPPLTSPVLAAIGIASAAAWFTGTLAWWGVLGLVVSLAVSASP